MHWGTAATHFKQVLHAKLDSHPKCTGRAGKKNASCRSSALFHEDDPSAVQVVVKQKKRTKHAAETRDSPCPPRPPNIVHVGLGLGSGWSGPTWKNQSRQINDRQEVNFPPDLHLGSADILGVSHCLLGTAQQGGGVVYHVGSG